MILVWGSIPDSPTARVLEALKAMAAPVVLVEPEQLHRAHVDVAFSPEPSGRIELDGSRIDVAAVRGFFLRPLEAQVESAASRAASDALFGLAATMIGCVVNRPGASRANHSKPYQAQLIMRAGFEAADTLVTTDVAAAQAFLSEHDTVVYKSVSGVRSIVARMGAAEATRLGERTFGPVQLQAFVPGVDVRVHVVGTRWFACSARSAAVDYRYAAQQGASVELEPFELPSDVGERLVSMVEAMGLRVAGVDLRWAPGDHWVCLEVNPSPGFPWYEDATDHPIAVAIAEELIAGAESFWSSPHASGAGQALTPPS